MVRSSTGMVASWPFGLAAAAAVGWLAAAVVGWLAAGWGGSDWAALCWFKNLAFRCFMLQYSGLWPMVRRKAVPERYAALRCLWHEVQYSYRTHAAPWQIARGPWPWFRGVAGCDRTHAYGEQ
eukprot:2737790-Prymnesium_polylepis.1